MKTNLSTKRFRSTDIRETLLSIVRFIVYAVIAISLYSNAALAQLPGPVIDYFDRRPDTLEQAKRSVPFAYRGVWSATDLESDTDEDWYKVYLGIDDIRYIIAFESELKSARLELYAADGSLIESADQYDAISLVNDIPQTAYLRIFTAGDEQGTVRFRIVPQYAIYPLVAYVDENLEIYNDAGRKSLFFLSGEIGDTGLMLFFDLADYAGMTGEGKDGWVTVWANFDFGVGLGTLPVKAGIQEIDFYQYGDIDLDGGSFFGVTTPFLEATLIDASPGSTYPDSSFYFGTPTSTDFSISAFNFSLPLAKIEIERSFLDRHFFSHFRAPTPTSLEKFVKTLLDVIFTEDGSQEPSIPYREATPSDETMEVRLLPEVEAFSVASLSAGRATVSIEASDEIGVSYIMVVAGEELVDSIVFDPPEKTISYRHAWDTSNYQGDMNVRASVYGVNGYPIDREQTYSIDNSISSSISISPFNVNVDEQFVVEGVISYSDDSPLVDAQACIWISSAVIDCSTTDLNGNYHINAVAPSVAGNFTVMVDATYGSQQSSASAQLLVTQPGSGRDIGIRQFSLSEYSTTPGGQLTLNATFDNLGNQREDIVAHWILYDPDGVERARHTQTYTDIAVNGSTGSVSEDLTTNTATGSWTAVVWAELETDENPQDNMKSLSFHVGAQPDYDQYARHSEAISEGASAEHGGYTVVANNAYGNGAAQYIVQGGPMVTLDPGEAFLYDNEKLVLLHEWADDADDLVQFQMWTIPPLIDFDVQPKKLTVTRGQRAKYTVSSAHSLYDRGISNITDDGPIVDDWDKDWSKQTIDSQTWELYANVPLDAEARTYEFWWTFTFAGHRTAQKVELTVLPEHDISVSAVQPLDGATFDPGQVIDISGVIHAVNGYTERPNVTLTITGPGGYIKTESRTPTVAGSQAVAFSPWNTTGLQPGQYTISVNGTIGDDANGGNNTQSVTVSLNAPAVLVVDAHSSESTVLQGETIDLMAIVTANGDPISDATVIAEVIWPPGNTTNTLLTFDSSARNYSASLMATQQGVYAVTVAARSSGYSDGSDTLGSITVNNAPPDTAILSVVPVEGIWIRNRDVNLVWSGTDSGTPLDQLQYATATDNGPWSAYGPATKTLLADLGDGLHTFSVKAYDGALEDIQPAIRTFSIDTISPVVKITTNGGNHYETTEMQVELNGTASDSLSGLDTLFSNTGTANQGTIESWQFTAFLEEGRNTIVFSVADIAGNVSQDSIIITRTVVVTNSPPDAIAGSDITASIGQQVSLGGTASTDDGAIIAYRWDIDAGDGVDFTTPDYVGAVVNHVYTHPGAYTVTLEVEDDAGETDTDTLVISVVPTSTGEMQFASPLKLADAQRLLRGLTTADLDKDGDLDVIVSGGIDAPYELSVWRNDGSPFTRILDTTTGRHDRK